MALHVLESFYTCPIPEIVPASAAGTSLAHPVDLPECRVLTLARPMTAGERSS